MAMFHMFSKYVLILQNENMHFKSNNWVEFQELLFCPSPWSQLIHLVYYSVYRQSYFEYQDIPFDIWLRDGP